MPHVALIIGGVILLLIVVVIVYRVIKDRQKREPMLISKPTRIDVRSPSSVIPGAKAPLSKTGQEYTYSFWIFVRDWSSGNKGKCVMYRGDDVHGSYEVASPSVWMYPKENKLMVRTSTQEEENTSDYDSQTYYQYDRTTDGHTIVNPDRYDGRTPSIWNSSYSCDVENIPLQRWVHVAITTWNRTMDVYVNGKLARSCILPGVPVHDANLLSNIYVGGPDGLTFNGYISRFKYMDRAATVSEVMQIYRKGPLAANWWWQAFKNRVKVILEIDSDN